MSDKRYQIELTEAELTAILADLNLQRMDNRRNGYGATAKQVRQNAETIIVQALAQGFEDGNESNFGGKIVKA